MEVTCKRRNKGIGLEIPATYSMYHKTKKIEQKFIDVEIQYYSASVYACMISRRL